MVSLSSRRGLFSRAAACSASFSALAVALTAAPALAESSPAPDAAAIAQSVDRTFQPSLDAQTFNIAAVTADPQAVPAIAVTAPDPQIVIANPGTPTTARDPVNVTGVGQMIVDQLNGFIGLCTGSLINPRTVIFAAHCVNTRAAGAYGQNSGGQPIGFGFGSNNNVSGASAFGGWLNGVAGGPKWDTNTARYMYDSNYVAYNPLSTEPNAAGFLYGDIAVASLDTPAANVPTWAVLFSQLPAVPITANGTGYHVTIDGYGNNGTATTGSTGGIDFRRRIAENTLGALASLDEFENFLFGSTGVDNPQNLYWIDFDDPLRGTGSASAFDFNAWRDNAQPNEGITASGDSGGPLILDRTYAKSVILGVLSGGYTRFFSGQPANGYGTASFYQPLYLYWDWIAANNPYHYVGSIAGNGDWTDPTHWVSNLDPNYQIIVNGQLVNGIPSAPGAGNTDQPGFGQACFQTTGLSDCLDIASGVETVNSNPIGTAANDAGQAQRGEVTEAVDMAAVDAGTAGTAGSRPTSGTLAPQATTAVLPSPTLASGLPGATNFVPNNYDGDRVARTAPRYFDVTLGAAGTTTLGSTVVIDRLTLSNANAALNIGTAGSLTSWISVTQSVGNMSVNGALTSNGDYFMLAGGLNGTGLITTPFYTNVAGTISPGSVGAAGNLGTLTFKGNTIFASGSVLLIDLGATGINDKIVVQTGAVGSGIANVGGTVLFNVMSGTQPRAGDIYTFLTAQNAVTGTFGASASISAILRPTLIYSPTSVAVQITAVPYASVVDTTSPVQVSYASLMDADRASSSGGALSALYGPLDLQSQGTIRAFFESAAPRTESARTGLEVAGLSTSDRFFRQRIHGIHPGSSTGSMALIGQPAALASQVGALRASTPMDSALGLAETTGTGGKLPDDMSGYLAAGYINGSSLPMPAAASSGRDTFDGWFAAAGVEKAVSEHTTLGIGAYYSNLSGKTGGVTQTTHGWLAQLNVYGAFSTDHGMRIDARLGVGLHESSSDRTVTLVNTPYSLHFKDDGIAFTGELGVGFDLSHKSNMSIVPRASLRYGVLGQDGGIETGGPMALAIQREDVKALEGRLGFSFSTKDMGSVRPFFEANYVHDFLDQPTSFLAGFAGGPAVAPFALTPTDNDWGEISGGIAFNLGKSAEVALEADTTILRDDYRNQSYRARVSFSF